MEVGPSLIGLVVGLVVGATSTGGGALLTPALILILRVPAPLAIGSDVLIASGMKLFGGSVYALRREVHWPTVGRLAVGSIPGAMVGLWVLSLLPASALDTYLSRGLGVVLMLAGAAVIIRLTIGGRMRPVRSPRGPVTVLFGFVAGVLVSMTSIGSGSLLLCALSLFYPLSATMIVGTDLVHALFLSSVATVGHSMAGRVDFGLAAAVLLGAVPGVLMGARLATAVPERTLRAGLAAVLLAIGLQLVVFSGSPAQATPTSVTQEGEISWTTTR